MKCIVIETSPERTNAHTVTNEDGTPHIYATISEARAELKANGYSYNRANQRYYINDTEYRAYIIREDSEEYAHALTTDTAEKTTYQRNQERNASANAAFTAFMDAYAEAIGERPAKDDPETRAARKIAAEAFGYLLPYPVTDDDRATVAAMVEAIAERWTQDHQPRDLFAELAEYEAELAPTYQRHELEAYLGEPDAYDVDAIEAEATEYDPETGRTYWRRGVDLAAIAERHERYSYAPAI